MTFFKILLFASQVFAGGSVVENGGTYAVCEHSPAQSSVFVDHVAILDIMEGHDDGLTYDKLARFRGKSLEVAFPQAVKLYFSRFKYTQYLLLELFKRRSIDIKFVPEATLSSRSRFSFKALARGCKVRQAAIQFVSNELPEKLKMPIRISREAWARFSTDQKIALLVHEYIQGTQYMATGSCAIMMGREATGRLLSDQSFGKSMNEWVKDVSFSCYESTTGE